MKTFIFLLLSTATLLALSSCNHNGDPYYPDFEHAGGYIIGKETCKANAADDEWLIDLNYELNQPNLNYGDTITINGIFYKHMVKTAQLSSDLKVIGMKVSFDFHLSPTKVLSSGCAVTNPITYNLKEMNVIATFRIG